MARWALAMAVLAVGCGRPAPPPASGAEVQARAWVEALRAGDWASAHAALEPQSRARCDTEQFARLAGNYRRQIGFEPRAGYVRFCEEKGTQAVAHVAFTGKEGARQRFKDAIVLRQGPDGWGVVLPERFGQRR
jgi:hypothetical protein